MESINKENRRKELENKFEDWYKNSPFVLYKIHPLMRKNVFNFFYSEIEAREKQWNDAMTIMGVHSKTIDMANKITHLEELLKAANNLIEVKQAPYPMGTDEYEIFLQSPRSLQQTKEGVTTYK